MAVDASSVSVVLGASSFGPGVVVTSAGIVFAQAASAPGANSDAYWYYNGTNLVGNVPTGKGFSFTVNGSAVAGLASDGSFTFGAVGAGTNFLRVTSVTGGGAVALGNTSGNADLFIGNGVATPASYGNTPRLRNQASGGILIQGNQANGVVTSIQLDAGMPLSTAGAKILSATNNGAEAASVNAVASPNSTGQVGQLNAPHFAGGSTALSLNTCRIGLGAGTTSSGTAVTASGHDLAGRIGVTVNSTGTANQPVLLVSWATAYNTPPFVTLTPGNAATAALATELLAVQPFAVATTSGLSVMGNTTGIPAGSYVFFYSCIQ